MSELAEEKSHSLKVSLQILIQAASDAGEKKKEEMAGYNPAELPRKKNLRKKNLPARIVEQAGVPIDRVIGLSRKRILIAHIWSMLS